MPRTPAEETRFDDYLGRPYQDVVDNLKTIHMGKVVAIRAGSVVTTDYDLSRLRVRYDENGLVVSVRMG